MRHSKLNNLDILNIYQIGSIVYGYKEPSDEDYIVIVKNDIKTFQIIEESLNITIYNEKQFQELINEHDPLSLECLFSPKEFKQEQITFSFKLDKTKLRNSFSQKASNSWVKSKKKLIIEKDYNLLVAQKSLFHSLRLLDFALDLAMIEDINFQKTNNLWKDIIKYTSWDDLNSNFKKIYNEKKTELRALCPKN